MLDRQTNSLLHPRVPLMRRAPTGGGGRRKGARRPEVTHPPNRLPLAHDCAGPSEARALLDADHVPLSRRADTGAVQGVGGSPFPSTCSTPPPPRHDLHLRPAVALLNLMTFAPPTPSPPHTSPRAHTPSGDGEPAAVNIDMQTQTAAPVPLRSKPLGMCPPNIYPLVFGHKYIRLVHTLMPFGLACGKTQLWGVHPGLGFVCPIAHTQIGWPSALAAVAWVASPERPKSTQWLGGRGRPC